MATGQIFRELAKGDNELGKYIREYMFAGYLVPDERVLEIVSDYLKKPEYMNGYILDGFPRTVNQAKSFQGEIDHVVYLKVSDKEAMKRISLRNDNARKDETEEAIQRRIELFHKETEPVIEFYRQKNRLIEVDGELTIDDIYKQILEKLKINYGK